MPVISMDDLEEDTEEEGNSYEGGEAISVEKGTIRILEPVYSTDYSAAYKVDVYYNTGIDFMDEEIHRYVKKGAAIPLWPMVEPEGLEFDGWYDDPEGGEQIANATEPFVPTADVVLYGHWRKM